MNIKPLGDRVLIKLNKSESKTSGGIYIPESQDEKRKGIIVALGNGEKISSLGLKKDDLVYFDNFGVTEVKVDDTDSGDKLIIIDVKNILAVLD